MGTFAVVPPLDSQLLAELRSLETDPPEAVAPPTCDESARRYDLVLGYSSGSDTVLEAGVGCGGGRVTNGDLAAAVSADLAALLATTHP